MKEIVEGNQFLVQLFQNDQRIAADQRTCAKWIKWNVNTRCAKKNKTMHSLFSEIPLCYNFEPKDFYSRRIIRHACEVIQLLTKHANLDQNGAKEKRCKRQQ